MFLQLVNEDFILDIKLHLKSKVHTHAKNYRFYYNTIKKPHRSKSFRKLIQDQKDDSKLIRPRLFHLFCHRFDEFCFDLQRIPRIAGQIVSS